MAIVQDSTNLLNEPRFPMPTQISQAVAIQEDILTDLEDEINFRQCLVGPILFVPNPMEAPELFIEQQVLVDLLTILN